MRLEQFLKARDIVNEDATIVGNYFGDYEGDSCAVGGLYIAVNPPLEDWDQYNKIMDDDILGSVMDAFGFTLPQVREIISTNDSIDEVYVDTFPYDLTDFVSYGTIDSTSYHEAKRIWDDNHFIETSVIERRREAIIKLMASFLHDWNSLNSNDKAKYNDLYPDDQKAANYDVSAYREDKTC